MSEPPWLLLTGLGLKPTEFLTALMTEFGYELELNSVEELLNMLNVFAVQQARSREAPVLILEHFNHMYPSTLNVLMPVGDADSEQTNSRYALSWLATGTSVA